MLAALELPEGGTQPKIREVGVYDIDHCRRSDKRPARVVNDPRSTMVRRRAARPAMLLRAASPAPTRPHAPRPPAHTPPSAAARRFRSTVASLRLWLSLSAPPPCALAPRRPAEPPLPAPRSREVVQSVSGHLVEQVRARLLYVLAAREVRLDPLLPRERPELRERGQGLLVLRAQLDLLPDARSCCGLRRHSVVGGEPSRVLRQ